MIETGAKEDTTVKRVAIVVLKHYNHLTNLMKLHT